MLLALVGLVSISSGFKMAPLLSIPVEVCIDPCCRNSFREDAIRVPGSRRDSDGRWHRDSLSLAPPSRSLRSPSFPPRCVIIAMRIYVRSEYTEKLTSTDIRQLGARMASSVVEQHLRCLQTGKLRVSL